MEHWKGKETSCYMPLLGTGGTCTVCKLCAVWSWARVSLSHDVGHKQPHLLCWLQPTCLGELLALWQFVFICSPRKQGFREDLLSTLKMLLCTNSTCSLCVSPFLFHWKRSGLDLWSLLFLTQSPKKKDCVSINDLLLCLGATVLQDFALMVLSQERTNLTNFINSSLF